MTSYNLCMSTTKSYTVNFPNQTVRMLETLMSPSKTLKNK